MMRRFFLLVCIVLFIISCNNEKVDTGDSYSIAFYNVENLFDTIDAPDKLDEEFTPGGAKHWNDVRYRKKLNDIARVIDALNPEDPPELIGLCEVENRLVLEELINTDPLRQWNYQIIHEESPDYRGIDVALLYRKSEFIESNHEAIPVVFPDDPAYNTRDILYIKGKISNRTVHIFVNHWPSRRGGQEKSEPKRVHAATVLLHRINIIQQDSPDANIIVMGDMNDEPTDKSLYITLGARSDADESPLVNLMLKEDQNQKGTYYYKGNWNMLDNLIVSKSMIDGKNFRIEDHKGIVFQSDFMLYTNKEGIQTPNRTYVGDRYVAGISDHFPVFFRFDLN